MQTFLLSIGFLSTLLGCILIVRQIKTKQIALYDLQEGIKEVKLDKDKKYAISIIGGFFDNDKGMKISLYSDKDIKLKKHNFKYQFLLNGEKAFDYYCFTIEESGVYKIKIENPEYLTLRNSNLYLKKLISPNKNHSRKIQVKESIGLFYKISIIFCLIIGVNILIGGLML